MSSNEPEIRRQARRHVLMKRRLTSNGRTAGYTQLPSVSPGHPPLLMYASKCPLSLHHFSHEWNVSTSFSEIHSLIPNLMEIHSAVPETDKCGAATQAFISNKFGHHCYNDIARFTCLSLHQSKTCPVWLLARN
jgi:hypothetical protein